MNRVFEIPEPSRVPVPDGTLLSPFLNPKDSKSPLPFDLFDGFSLAAGRVEPGLKSKIQFLPFVTQVTFVLKGRLQAWMKGEADETPYCVDLTANQAALTLPNTFLQLVNPSGHEPCKTLYIVCPAYLFLFDEESKQLIYDDSVILDEDWDDLREADWCHAASAPTVLDRKEAYSQLAQRRQ